VNNAGDHAELDRVRSALISVVVGHDFERFHVTKNVLDPDAQPLKEIDRARMNDRHCQKEWLFYEN
jgi:hypothetical protein